MHRVLFIHNTRFTLLAETIGDGYMVVVGILKKEEHHAQFAADMAMAMIKGLKGIELPFLNDFNIRVRIGE